MKIKHEALFTIAYFRVYPELEENVKLEMNDKHRWRNNKRHWQVKHLQFGDNTSSDSHRLLFHISIDMKSIKFNEITKTTNPRRIFL